MRNERERAGAHGQDHVVDGGAGGVLQPFDVVEADGGESHAPAPGQRHVERGAGGGEGESGLSGRFRRGLARPSLGIQPLVGPDPDPAHVEYPVTGAHHVLGDLEGPHGPGHRRLAHQLEAARDVLVDRSGRIGDVGGSGRRRGRLEVEEHREQRGAGHPVHGGMVHLGDDGDALVGQALDDPHLPQRLGPVELVTGDVAGQVGQLAQAAGTGHGRPPHVVVDVEVGVVDPHRMAQAERDLDQPPPEDRGAGDPGGDGLLHPLEGVAPGTVDGSRTMVMATCMWRLGVSR